MPSTQCAYTYICSISRYSPIEAYYIYISSIQIIHRETTKEEEEETQWLLPSLLLHDMTMN